MNKSKKTILILIIFFVSLAGNAGAETITDLEIIQDSDLIKIKSGDVFVVEEGVNFVVKANKSLVVEYGANLIIESGATVEFAADSLVEIRGTLTNHGKIINNGLINNYGTLINYELQDSHYQIQHRPGIINNYGSINNYNHVKNYSVINGDINSAPEASIEGPGELIVNNEATFNGSNSTDPDGLGLIYYWDFGDGNNVTSDKNTCTHVFEKTGIYMVELTVEDNFSATDSDTMKLVVIDEQDKVPKIYSTLSQEEDVVDDTNIGTMAKMSSTLDFPSVIFPFASMVILTFVFRRKKE